MRATSTRARATAAVLSLLLAPIVTGCSVSAGSEGTGNCTVKANNVHESSGSPGFIVAKMQITCSVALDRLSGTVKLQRRLRGLWIDIPFTANTQTETGTRAGKTYVIQTDTYTCRRGVFRSAARGSGVLDGRPSASATWQYGNPVTDPCR